MEYAKATVFELASGMVWPAGVASYCSRSDRLGFVHASLQRMVGCLSSRVPGATLALNSIDILSRHDDGLVRVVLSSCRLVLSDAAEMLYLSHPR